MDDATKQFVQAEAANAAQELGVPDEPANEPAPETPQQATVEQPSEPAQAPVEQPAPVEEPDDDESDIPTFAQRPQQPSQTPQTPAPAPIEVKPLDPKDFSNDVGEIDTNAFAQAMQTRDEQLRQAMVQDITQQLIPSLQQQIGQVSAQQVTAVKREERQWEQAFKKYPEIQENKELRDTVHQYRIGVLQTQGVEITPRQAADRVLKFSSQAKQQGAKEATQSVRIQASGHLETADNTASDRGLKQQQTLREIDSRDRRVATQAREDTLKDMLAKGLI